MIDDTKVITERSNSKMNILSQNKYSKTKNINNDNDSSTWVIGTQ